MAISPEKKRYSLSLTKATMDTLHDQFVTLGEKGRKQVSAVITLMVDQYLKQMSEVMMPVIIKNTKAGKKPLSELEFAELLLQTVRKAADETSKETIEAVKKSR